MDNITIPRFLGIFKSLEKNNKYLGKNIINIFPYLKKRSAKTKIYLETEVIKLFPKQ